MRITVVKSKMKKVAFSRVNVPTKWLSPGFLKIITYHHHFGSFFDAIFNEIDGHPAWQFTLSPLSENYSKRQSVSPPWCHCTMELKYFWTFTNCQLSIFTHVSYFVKSNPFEFKASSEYTIKIWCHLPFLSFITKFSIKTSIYNKNLKCLQWRGHRNMNVTVYFIIFFNILNLLKYRQA